MRGRARGPMPAAAWSIGAGFWSASNYVEIRRTTLQATTFRNAGHCATTHATCSALVHTGVVSSGAIGDASAIARCVIDSDAPLIHQEAGPVRRNQTEKPHGQERRLH